MNHSHLFGSIQHGLTKLKKNRALLRQERKAIQNPQVYKAVREGERRIPMIAAPTQIGLCATVLN